MADRIEAGRSWCLFGSIWEVRPIAILMTKRSRLRTCTFTDSRAYALLNDGEQPISSSVLDALRSYEVRPVMWSRRDEVRDELAA